MQGAGYAVSRKMVRCFANQLADLQYVPSEDVATGLLAYQCDVTFSISDKIFTGQKGELIDMGKRDYLVIHRVGNMTNMGTMLQQERDRKALLASDPLLDPLDYPPPPLMRTGDY